MRLCGVPIGSIRLTASGAVIEGGFSDYRREILCAAAGPVAGLLSAALLIPVAPRGAAVGLLLSIVNLLPLYALDGGRILRGVLLLCCSEERARKTAYTVSIAVSCLLMLLACWATVCLQAGLWPIFAAMMLLWRAGERDQ
ncbi:MAG: site-2 protease family protein [Oscillospiraceae bacterium]|nr:site-2 protease family protein [Oscillospiraceae bacterium]